MIGFQIDQAKGLFFDPRKIEDPAERASKSALSKFGGRVRLRAKQSMRRVTKKMHKAGQTTAPAGSPPYVHVGLLRQFLFYGLDPSTRSVVIGPAKLNGKIGNAPEALEYGGTSLIRAGTRKKPETKHAKIHPHPFMQPAFNAELPSAPGYFRDSIQ
jgi:hypothetical protein